MSLVDWAKFYYEKGLSVIPLKFKEKIPLIPWEKYQHERATIQEIEEWFKEGWKNIGVVCGKVSGNLIVIDFDSQELFNNFVLKISEYPLSEKFKNTWIIRTGKGYHFYFRVDEDLTTTRRFNGIEIRGDGSQVVAPPSMHPSGKVYEFVEDPHERDIIYLNKDEYNIVLKVIEELVGVQKTDRTTQSTQPKTEFKQLSDNEILRIVELLKPAYKPGNRELLIGLYLAAWFYRKKIAKESIVKIAELLAKEDNSADTEQKLKRILKQIDYHYSGRYEKYEEEKGKELKGKGGVQEILEQTLGEQKALEIMEELQKILGASPYATDAIFSLIDISRQLYYIAIPRKGWIVRAQKKLNMEEMKTEIVYKEIIAECCPTKVVVYEDPLGGLRKFEIEFIGMLNKTIGPAELDVIVNRLKADAVVKHQRLIHDALSSIILAFIRHGKAEIRRELEKPGFYYIDGEIKSVKWQLNEYEKKDLAKSLELLNELRCKWYSRIGEKFTTMIKWGLIAPFAYCIKQIRKTVAVHFPDIVAYGARDTGKTTIGAQIILSIWNPPEEARIVRGGGDADTKAKHGRLRSLTTFPVVINEVEGIFNNKELLEDYKNAVENRFVRGRHQHGVYVEFPALAPFFMTMNAPLPLDEAIRKRFMGIHFSLADKITKEEMEKFKVEILPRLGDLRYLGYFVYENIAKNPELLKKDWTILATELLKKAFEFCDMDVPEWVDELYTGESEEEIAETINEEIRSRLLEDINNRYSRYISRVEVTTEEDSVTSLYVRFKALLNNRFLPWALAKGDNLIITSSVLRILKDCGIDSLKSLAERFGWKYALFKLNGRVIRGVEVPIDELVAFLEKSPHQSQSSDDKDWLDDMLKEW